MAEGVGVLLEGSASLSIHLDEHQAASFEAYAELLLAWNRRFTRLGPRAAAEMWSRHCLDALTVVLALPGKPVERERTCLDVGSGAGIPGIPLAIAFPRWQVTLLEVTAKKVRFLELAREHLRLANVRVVGGHAQELAHDAMHRAAYDLCVARAVARTAAVLELTLPFVHRNGDVILYKGVKSLRDELNEAEAARHMLGASAPEVTSAVLAGSIGGCLVRYQKVAETPAALPRRPGSPPRQPHTARDVR
jgi:16S rRNA (guanine527-N7)-methyltransferase